MRRQRAADQRGRGVQRERRREDGEDVAREEDRKRGAPLRLVEAERRERERPHAACDDRRARARSSCPAAPAWARARRRSMRRGRARPVRLPRPAPSAAVATRPSDASASARRSCPQFDHGVSGRQGQRVLHGSSGAGGQGFTGRAPHHPTPAGPPTINRCFEEIGKISPKGSTFARTASAAYSSKAPESRGSPASPSAPPAGSLLGGRDFSPGRGHQRVRVLRAPEGRERFRELGVAGEVGARRCTRASSSSANRPSP